MHQRAITEEEVEYCLENPDTTYTDRKGNTIYRNGNCGGKRIKVVVDERISPPSVITVADY